MTQAEAQFVNQLNVKLAPQRARVLWDPRRGLQGDWVLVDLRKCDLIDLNEIARKVGVVEMSYD